MHEIQQRGCCKRNRFSKRVELWGEGQSFFDIKRLNLPVTRGYAGTLHHTIGRFNTTTRPAWMNFCIVRSEGNNNTALVGFETQIRAMYILLGLNNIKCISI